LHKETRSKSLAGPPAPEDSPIGPPESLGSRAPSEENLNFTVVLGDGTAGTVGASCSGVGVTHYHYSRESSLWAWAWTWAWARSGQGTSL